VKKSILDDKRILAVDDEPDVLSLLEEEIMEACPTCIFDKATSHEQAVELMRSWTYDLVILDIMGVQGFDLLKRAVDRPYPFPVVMLTAHALSPEALKRSIELGARAYLPKEKLGQIVPFLKDVMKYEFGPGWKRLLKKLEGFFDEHWGPYWKTPEEKFWKEFDKKTAHTKE